MDLPDFSDTDFTAHKGVKKRPTTGRPKTEPTPEPEEGWNARSTPDEPAPEKPKPKRKPGPGAGAPRHVPRTGKYKKRNYKTEKRQKSRSWCRTGKWKEPFLEFLRDTGHKTAAAEMAGISRNTVTNHEEKDLDFKNAVDEAMEVAHGRLFASIMERGTRGKKKYAIIHGERKYIGREPSDLLAMFMMKKLDPSFRDSYDGGSGNAAVQMTNAIVNFLRLGDPRGNNQLDAPTFQEFIDGGGLDMKVIEVAPETPEQKVERLRAELAAAEAAIPREPTPEES